MTAEPTWTPRLALDEAIRLLELAAKQHASGILPREQLDTLHSGLTALQHLVHREDGRSAERASGDPGRPFATKPAQSCRDLGH
jgi:hypothetical protein